MFWIQVGHEIVFINIILLHNFLLKIFFDKSIIRLHYLFIIPCIHAKYDDN